MVIENGALIMQVAAPHAVIEGSTPLIIDPSV
jgi:hypothetical protein